MPTELEMQAIDALHRMNEWKPVDAAAVDDSIPYSQLMKVMDLPGGGVVMIFHDGRTWFGVGITADKSGRIKMSVAEAENE